MTLRAVAPGGDLYVEDRRSIRAAASFSKSLAAPLARSGADLVATTVAPHLHVFPARLGTALRSTPLFVTWHEVWNRHWYEYLGVLGSVGRTVERTIARLPHHPVVPSELTARRLREIGVRSGPVSVVPNGIDYDRIRSTPPAEEGYDVLYAGRLAANKNVDLLLSAFDRIAEEYDLTLGVVGGGPMGDRYRSLAADLDSADRVDFLGFLPDHDDVLAQMRAADVFVSPSTREGFGITLAEAMAAGCVVVAADHPQSAGSEVLGDAGFLAPPTVAGLTSEIVAALGSDPSPDAVAAAERYDWDAITDQTLALYREAV